MYFITVIIFLYFILIYIRFSFLIHKLTLLKEASEIQNYF